MRQAVYDLLVQDGKQAGLYNSSINKPQMEMASGSTSLLISRTAIGYSRPIQHSRSVFAWWTAIERGSCWSGPSCAADVRQWAVVPVMHCQLRRL